MRPLKLRLRQYMPGVTRGWVASCGPYTRLLCDEMAFINPPPLAIVISTTTCKFSRFISLLVRVVDRTANVMHSLSPPFVRSIILIQRSVDPILKRLATGWERAFQTRLPKAFNTYVTNSGKIIHKFHEAVEERARDNGVGLANLSMLKTQIHNYEQAFKDLGILLVTQMTELQREANRDFTPTIANIMHTVYDNCTVERGPGQYKRMKEFMRDHVEQERHRMFHEAVKTVEKHLDAMCKALQESMEAKADEIFV
jgi:hypothetical protein